MPLKFTATLICILSLSIFAQAEERVRRNVEIEWDVVEGASSYEVRVTRKDEAKSDKKKKPLLFKTKKPQWAATIKPGIYNMEIRSYDDRGAPGSWSPPSELVVKLPGVIAISPTDKLVIPSDNEKNFNVQFKWEVVPGATKYRIKAQTADGSWKVEKDVEGTKWTSEIPVGHTINWEVATLDEKNEEGDKWESPQSFELHGSALKTPEIEKPLSEILRELKWSAPEYAKSYKLTLKFYNKKTKKWETVDRKEDFAGTTFPLDTSRPTGKYRFEVQAIGDKRAPSTVAKLTYKMRGGFRDTASLDTAVLRQSIVKPTRFYAIGSFATTQVQYEANNFDANTKSAFNSGGATARIGLGYQRENSNWGYFGIVDMAMLSIAAKQYTFSSIEAHITRNVEFGQKGIFLASTGIYTKELPLVLGSATLGYTGAGKVQNIGPHAGFTYWLPLSDRWGVQFNGRIYYSLMGSAPSGDIQSTMSYQAGLLGSYRWSTNWMTYLGYSYRADSAEYSASPSNSNSFAQPGQVNNVDFGGHVLGLTFEYSF